MKLFPEQVSLEHAGHTFKHIIVTLRGDQTIDQLRASPGAFRLTQPDRTNCVRRGDLVTILSADGLVKADSLTVIRAMGPDVWLGKPLRLVKLEPDIMFSDAVHEIVPAGAGFSIKHKRGGHIDDKVFASVASAKAELARRAPAQV